MKITIGITSRGADIYYKLVDWLVYYNQCRPIEWDLEIAVHMSPYSADAGQQKVFDSAVNNNSDYLFIVDADVCPPKGCIEKMIERGKDIILAPVWHFDNSLKDIHLGIANEPTLKKRIYSPSVGLQQIFGGGFGAMLVSKKVLNSFNNNKESFTKWSSILPEDSKDLASDNIFFQKCQKLGLEVFVDWDIKKVSHYRPVELCQETVDNLLSKHYAIK